MIVKIISQSEYKSKTVCSMILGQWDIIMCRATLYNQNGQYLDGRPPGKTRLLLEEVLVRQAGGAHPAVCVVLMPQYSDGKKSIVFRMRR